MKKLEIIFWQVAIKILERGYGINNPIYDESMLNERAIVTVNFIKEHIELLKS